MRRIPAFLVFIAICIPGQLAAQPQAGGRAAERIRVILDADTANEVDDLYAITRGLIEPSWHVLGLNATQWQASQWATAQTMEDSRRLNDVVQRWFGHPDGSRERRVIWDLALVSAMIHPHWAEKVQVRTSKERGDRLIWMYRDINADAMRQEFYRTLLGYIEGLR